MNRQAGRQDTCTERDQDRQNSHAGQAITTDVKATATPHGGGGGSLAHVGVSPAHWSPTLTGQDVQVEHLRLLNVRPPVVHTNLDQGMTKQFANQYGFCVHHLIISAVSIMVMCITSSPQPGVLVKHGYELHSQSLVKWWEVICRWVLL